MTGEETAGLRDILKPAKKLRSKTSYIAPLTTAARDRAGNTLDQNNLATNNQPMTWKFSVQ